MSYSNFTVVERQPNGCVHAAAPHGCGIKIIECAHCGTRYTQRCGNDPVLSSQVAQHGPGLCASSEKR